MGQVPQAVQAVVSPAADGRKAFAVEGGAEGDDLAKLAAAAGDEAFARNLSATLALAATPEVAAAASEIHAKLQAAPQLCETVSPARAFGPQVSKATQAFGKHKPVRQDHNGPYAALEHGPDVVAEAEAVLASLASDVPVGSVVPAPAMPVA